MMRDIPIFDRRPTWNDELSLLVPKPEFQAQHELKKGSAIVAAKRPSGEVTAYFEGNIYGASNIKTFDDKAVIAFGRFVQNYPTSALMVVDPDEYEVVGTIRAGKCNLEPTPAYESWVNQSAL